MDSDYSSDSSIEEFTEHMKEEFTDNDEEEKYQKIVVRREEGRKATFIALKENPFWFLRANYPSRYVDQRSARWFHAMKRMKKYRESCVSQAVSGLIMLKKA